MKILFSMRHLGSFRLYESAVRSLAERGHRIHIMAERRESLGWGRALEALLAQHPNVTWSWSVPFRPNLWFELGKTVPIWLDYLRYFDPRYDGTPKLRERAEERVPAALVKATQVIGVGPRGRRMLMAGLRLVERALPKRAELARSIGHYHPDVVLLTPLVNLGSSQLEVLRSARALGLKTALCVGSWDHLSSKALIRDMPDRILVWNETQKGEAVALHGVPSDRVVVTGAQCYDHWFDRRPARSRETFCRGAGLPPEPPFLLYVCSALFQGSPVEAEFVERWIRHLRASAVPALASAGILVRPHPARTHEWRAVDLSAYAHVSLYGSNPIDESAKDDYFDSLYHSAAVVGLNTSAFLEAGIVGRPVHTIMLPEFRENQEGTLHFHYLVNVGGGLLHVARSLDEHEAQLAASLATGAAPGHGNRRFVEVFIRPHGLEAPATPIFVAAVESMERVPAPHPERVPAWMYLLRAPLLAVALLVRLALGASDPSGDRTSQEIRRARIRERQRRRWLARRRKLEALRSRQRVETLRQRAEKRQQAALAREEHRKRRAVRLGEHERRKAEIRRDKERRKLEKLRLKRRARMKELLKQTLGLATRSHE